jgi:hypothetical protein
MRFITQKIRDFLKKKEQAKVLGRWQIDYCNKKIDKKIDLSNEDHCGPCGNNNIENLDPKIYEKK